MMAKRTAIFVFDDSLDPDRVVDACRSWGIDELILHPGFFADSCMERALARRDLGLWLNLPVFFSPDHLEEHPEDFALTCEGKRAEHGWSRFVCPTVPGFVDELAERYGALAARLSPVRISLDFVRHFVFLETVPLDGNLRDIVDGCYCPRCLAAFEAWSGYRLPKGKEVAALRGPYRDAWAIWKCNVVSAAATRLTDALREASPSSRLLIKTIPWKQADLEGAIRAVAGQDIAVLGSLADGLVPMAFSHLLGRNEDWKSALMNEVRALSGHEPLAYVQGAAILRDDSIAPQDVQKELRQALDEDGECVAVFCYDQLVEMPAVARAIRSVLKPSAEVW